PDSENSKHHHDQGLKEAEPTAKVLRSIFEFHMQSRALFCVLRFLTTPISCRSSEPTPKSNLDMQSIKFKAQSSASAAPQRPRGPAGHAASSGELAALSRSFRHN